MKYIPLRPRLSIFIAAKIYRGIGLKIRRRGKKYNRQRIYLNIFEKILITFQSFFTFIFLTAFSYKYIKLRDTLPNENL